MTWDFAFYYKFLMYYYLYVLEVWCENVDIFGCYLMKKLNTCLQCECKEDILFVNVESEYFQNDPLQYEKFYIT